MVTKSYVDFFRGLEKNNHKEWFHANKQAYENDVKQPFLRLLEALLPELLSLDAAISADPKDALFRINRDIRFSKDKTPYHTLLKASLTPGGKKSGLPGFYLGISAYSIHVGGGMIQLKGPALKAIRVAIAERTEEFMAIVKADSFTTKFGELKGESAKRMDKQFQATLEKTPLIALKQFYAMRELPLAAHLNSSEVPTMILNYFKAIHPLNHFLKSALL
ncbi:MAG: DUF2461 domain-containing protein [Bacteroidota bacterium]